MSKKQQKPIVKTDINGDKRWYLDGKYHREDGPAIERTDGSKYWHLNGKFHRKDGPAIERTDGSKYWYLNGKQLTEEEFKIRQQEPTILKPISPFFILDAALDAIQEKS